MKLAVLTLKAHIGGCLLPKLYCVLLVVNTKSTCDRASSFALSDSEGIIKKKYLNRGYHTLDKSRLRSLDASEPLATATISKSDSVPTLFSFDGLSSDLNVGYKTQRRVPV